MTRVHPRSSGFTLIEILIAMAVFLIGVVSIIAVFPQGIKSSTQSVNDSVAAYVVESLFDSLKDALRRNRVDEGGQETKGYHVRFYHDGLPAAGGTFRLPRMVWDDDGNDLTQRLPDYLTDDAIPANDAAANPGNTRMATPRTAGDPDNEHALRGWWFPDYGVKFTPGGSNPFEPLGSSETDLDNNGQEVVSLGQLPATTGEAVASKDVDFPDPLSRFSYNFLTEIWNRSTTGGETAGDGGLIPSSPLPDEGSLFNPTKTPEEIRKKYVRGLARYSFYIYRNWNPAYTIDFRSREDNMIRRFHFGISFLQ